MGVGKVRCLVSDLRIFYIFISSRTKKAYVYLVASHLRCWKSPERVTASKHTLCWKHSIILASSSFIKNFPDFQVNSNGNYVMTLGQSLFSQLYGCATIWIASAKLVIFFELEARLKRLVSYRNTFAINSV